MGNTSIRTNSMPFDHQIYEIKKVKQASPLNRTQIFTELIIKDIVGLSLYPF